MPKVVIRNRAEPEWTPVIKTRLQLMLGSMLVNSSRVEIELWPSPERRGHRLTYGCRLTLTESNGERYLLHNEQPDALLAIEGAIARARRTMTRLKRHGAPGWRETSTVQQISPGMLDNV